MSIRSYWRGFPWVGYAFVIIGASMVGAGLDKPIVGSGLAVFGLGLTQIVRALVRQ